MSQFLGRTLPHARKMMAVGMICLAVALIFPYPFHPTGAFGLNLTHAVRGMLVGLSITLNLWSLAAMASRQRQL
jgi:hypothetical protein